MDHRTRRDSGSGTSGLRNVNCNAGVVGVLCPLIASRRLEDHIGATHCAGDHEDVIGLSHVRVKVSRELVADAS